MSYINQNANYLKINRPKDKNKLHLLYNIDSEPDITNTYSDSLVGMNTNTTQDPFEPLSDKEPVFTFTLEEFDDKNEAVRAFNLTEKILDKIHLTHQGTFDYTKLEKMEESDSESNNLSLPLSLLPSEMPDEIDLDEDYDFSNNMDDGEENYGYKSEWAEGRDEKLMSNLDANYPESFDRNIQENSPSISQKSLSNSVTLNMSNLANLPDMKDDKKKSISDLYNESNQENIDKNKENHDPNYINNNQVKETEMPNLINSTSDIYNKDINQNQTSPNPVSSEPTNTHPNPTSNQTPIDPTPHSPTTLTKNPPSQTNLPTPHSPKQKRISQTAPLPEPKLPQPKCFTTFKAMPRESQRIFINLYHTKYDILKNICVESPFFFKVSYVEPYGEEEEIDSMGNKHIERVDNKEFLHYDFIWYDGYYANEKFMTMKSYQKINHFPGMQILCWKNSLAMTLSKMQKIVGFDDFNFAPKTYLLPEEEDVMIRDEEMFNIENKKYFFIIKPENSCQGKGIQLVRNLADIKEIETDETRWVCQDYLLNPLLIEGLKFDLRIYVLLTSIEPLRVFLHEDGFMRFCTYRYEEPSKTNMNTLYMHLTNYAINKFSKNFVKNNNTNFMDGIASKRHLHWFKSWIKKQGRDPDEIFSRVEEIVVKTLMAAQQDLIAQYKKLQPNDFTNNMCFEVLGFDVMFDSDFNPYLLEVNHAPSFTTDSAFDEKVKHKVLTDTFKILYNVGPLSKKAHKDYKQFEMDMKYMYKKVLSREDKEDYFKPEIDKKDRYQMSHCQGYKRIHPTMNVEIQKNYDRIYAVIKKDASLTNQTLNKGKNAKVIEDPKSNKKKPPKFVEEKEELTPDDSSKVAKSKEEVQSIVNRLYYSRNRGGTMNGKFKGYRQSFSMEIAEKPSTNVAKINNINDGLVDQTSHWYPGMGSIHTNGNQGYGYGHGVNNVHGLSGYESQLNNYEHANVNVYQNNVQGKLEPQRFIYHSSNKETNIVSSTINQNPILNKNNDRGMIDPRVVDPRTIDPRNIDPRAHSQLVRNGMNMINNSTNNRHEESNLSQSVDYAHIINNNNTGNNNPHSFVYKSHQNNNLYILSQSRNNNNNYNQNNVPSNQRNTNNHSSLQRNSQKNEYQFSNKNVNNNPLESYYQNNNSRSPQYYEKHEGIDINNYNNNNYQNPNFNSNNVQTKQQKDRYSKIFSQDAQNNYIFDNMRYNGSKPKDTGLERDDTYKLFKKIIEQDQQEKQRMMNDAAAINKSPKLDGRLKERSSELAISGRGAKMNKNSLQKHKYFSNDTRTSYYQ